MLYPYEIIDQVRASNDIVDVIGQVVKLKRSGSSYICLCPFHSEKTPSFTVSRQKQMYYCFGCHRGGNVITFVEEYNNMSFREAIEYLAGRSGIKLPERGYSSLEKKEFDEKRQLLMAYRLAGTYYYYCLRRPEGRPGMEYLRGRMLSDETMNSFALGFAPKDLPDGLYRFLRSKGLSDDLLKDSGLMNVNARNLTMYDRFWNRVIFPIMDMSDRVIGFGARVMGEARPKYLNSPETKIFSKSRNLYALNIARRTRKDYLVLCEGYMDVITMHQAGFDNAVASLGTALTPGHCALLARYTKKVVLSYDSDDAGVSAAIRALPMLVRSGITPQILKLDPCKDPDEFIKKFGSGSMEERLESPENALMFQISIIRRNYDLNDPGAKTKFFIEAAGLIAKLDSEMERDNYIDAICREYMVEKRSFRELVMRRLVLGPSLFASHEGTGEGAVTEMTETDREWGVGGSVISGADGEGYGSGSDFSGSVGGFSGKMGMKERGDEISRRLLLNYISMYPAVFPIVKRYISASDFGRGLAGKVAALLYDQMEKDGSVDEAALLSHFPDVAEQSRIASIFHIADSVSSPLERAKAIRETILKVYSAASDSEETDFQRARDRKNIQKELRTLSIPV